MDWTAMMPMVEYGGPAVAGMLLLMWGMNRWVIRPMTVENAAGREFLANHLTAMTTAQHSTARELGKVAATLNRVVTGQDIVANLLSDLTTGVARIDERQKSAD